jgi:excinuclease ABC subunit C
MNIKDFSIPQTPGCYLFKDDKEQIIYVGKSKFLPKRVSSYFQKNHKDKKTLKLVTEIKNVDFISTESENEALVLEEDLIKLYKPKFNIKGKDDRTIRSKLVLTGGDWKKLELYFPHEEFDGEVLCEFTSGKVAKEVYESIYDIFQLRSCSYNITDENVTKGKFKSCLEYHMGRCSAPCVGLAKKIDYLFTIKLIKDIFSYNFNTSIKYFKRKMMYHSSVLEFELAQKYKIKILVIEKIKKLLNPVKKVENKKRVDEIKDLLELKFSPMIIDAFDNSHTAGTDAVCGMVRFTLLEADKSEWRKFNIKSGSGGDDYGSFNEVLMRRFTRLLTENVNLPNLLVIDGARPQLNVALSVLKKLNISDRLDVISISKNDRHQANMIHLSSGKDISIKGFNELAYILNEVHRFSLDFHRKKRSKSFLESKK